jgi:hypothetical protein
MIDITNDKLFCTIGYDVGKRFQNSDVCVPTINGETYYRKLTQVIGITTGQSTFCLSVIGQTTQGIGDTSWTSMA